MKHLTRMIAIAALIIVGCDKNKTDFTEFSTPQEADSVYSKNFENNESGENPALLGAEAAMSAAEVAANFSGSLSLGFRTPFTGNRLSKSTGPNSLVYDLSTHFWVLDSTFVFENEHLDGTVAVNGKVRFTPRNAFGMPTDETDRMEYMVTVDGEASGHEDSVNYHASINYASDFDITGIAKFRADSGNITINGSTSASVNITATTNTQNVTITYSASHEVDHVVFRPHHEENHKYPLSGTIRFKVKHATSVQGDTEVNVEGTITFDGDNTAVMVFGGVTFMLNLDTGKVTLA